MGGFVLNYGGFVVFCWFVLLDCLDSIFALNCLPYSVIYDDRLATDERRAQLTPFLRLPGMILAPFGTSLARRGRLMRHWLGRFW